MGTNSSTNRARNRAIRRRMQASGEPWTVAARANASQASPATPTDPVNPSPARTTVMDFDALRDSLMDWAYDQAAGRFHEIVHVTPFAEAHDVDTGTAFTLVRACRDMGLARDESTFGGAALQLTPAGISAVLARRRRRDDPALRAAAARSGLLRWLYRQELAGVRRAWPKQFADTDDAMYEGSRLSSIEIDHAAEYLAAKGLIDGTKVYGGQGLERAAITVDGRDCVTNWGGDVSGYLRGQQHAATTYNGPVIHGNADGAQLAWDNTGTVNQSQTHNEQIAPDFVALAQAVTDTMRHLSAMGLAAQDR